MQIIRLGDGPIIIEPEFETIRLANNIIRKLEFRCGVSSDARFRGERFRTTLSFADNCGGARNSSAAVYHGGEGKENTSSTSQLGRKQPIIRKEGAFASMPTDGCGGIESCCGVDRFPAKRMRGALLDLSICQVQAGAVIPITLFVGTLHRISQICYVDTVAWINNTGDQSYRANSFA